MEPSGNKKAAVNQKKARQKKNMRQRLKKKLIYN